MGHTVVSTLAQSYLHASGHSAAGAAELVISRSEAKYSCFLLLFLRPVRVFSTKRARNFGGNSSCSLDFLTEPEVGRWLSAATGDAREMAFVFQRISVALQRFNAVLTQESFVVPTSSQTSSHSNMCFSFFLALWQFYTIGLFFKIISVQTVLLVPSTVCNASAFVICVIKNYFTLLSFHYK